MYKVNNFIRWALTHAKGGAEPWNYLFGSVRVKTDANTLDRYYENHYKSQMTRERYDQLTADWPRDGYATDCQGLLDAYLTYECGDQTDINADMNYRLWCTDRGRIEDINRGFVIGEAVFMANNAGRMTHIGWVCGFDGFEPLIVEARGIAYGVVVTQLYDRRWTHRGIMTKKFEYTEEHEMIKFEVAKPMHSGEAYLAMQKALNLAGYTDADSNALEEDGKWGRRSEEALVALLQAHSAFIGAPAPEPEPVTENATEAEPVLTAPLGDYTVVIFRTADLPEAPNE